MCMMITNYLTHSLAGTGANTGYYFCNVGLAQDLNGRDKKRSFYYTDINNQLKIVGCQVVQRGTYGVVVQAIKFFEESELLTNAASKLIKGHKYTINKK